MLYTLLKTKTYAFIGPSGTGKSYRAQYVAGIKNINYIIDDGLLIKDNEVIAGVSAKKAPTKIETVRNALFGNEEKRKEIQDALRKYKPESILILGTSDGMVDKIAENLGLSPISERVYINDVATEEEMETARRIRVTQGKHVIPVPTFEIKKDFSGYLLDPLQIFKAKGKNGAPYISEKSIIRPTFSYMGNFTISDSVFKDIIKNVSSRVEGVHKILKARIDKTSEDVGGVIIYMEVSINYGVNIVDTLLELKKRITREIENLTAMYVAHVDIVAKNINFDVEE
ncbi:MAG: Asp23/Gls24 family envelope stress response protein [Clostridia bacterium]|nr:Asp23/Gls24 family envelope stress response protein [Clostridia bacterium]